MALPAERLARLAALIDELQALPGAGRAAWLQALPAADAELRPHLQAWLDEDAQTTQAQSGQAAWAPPEHVAMRALQALQQGAEPSAGQLIGPWRLLAPLGRGGMGVVWRAERCDGAYQRQVALKLPLSGPAPARLAERFARERDILASLSHPHIARLFDAGVNAGGQPYMALELVDGEPLHTWADRQRLGLRERVGLVQQVLQAVRHAHQRLVVHRDLKPSNILVRPDGQVQLLDFGIARLLDDGTTPATAALGTPDLTEFGSAVMTPSYAAPEQVERLPISTASDLYSLGVVLYELLCGASPYKVARNSRAALEEAILNVDPDRPSDAITAEAAALRGLTLARLRRALRGDLDAITLKALRKSPAERYASADAMAQDLQRWLDGLPVQAQPSGAGYRLRKLLRRHLAASVAAATAVLALVVGTGVATWQAGRAQAQARRAQTAQAFLIDLFDAAAPARAQRREATARDLMARAEELLPARLAQEPEMANELRGALVQIYQKLADGKRALPLAQARVDSLRANPSAPAAERGAALFQLGRVQVETGRAELGLASYEEAASLLPAASDEHLLLQEKIGEALSELKRWPEARTRLLAVLPTLQARFGERHVAVLACKVMLVSLHVRAAAREPALALIQELEPLLDQGDPGQAVEFVRFRHRIADTLLIDGQWQAAERMQLRALAELDRLVGPRNTLSYDLLARRAALLDTLGRERESDATLQQLVAMAQSLYGEADIQTALVESYRVAPLIKLGRAAEAEAAVRHALAGVEGQKALPEPELRGIRRRLGLALLFNGQAAAALPILQAVVTADGPRQQWPSLAYLAAAQLANGQAQAARQTAEQNVAYMLPKRTVVDRVLLAKAQLNLALALAAEGHAAEAAAPIDAAQAALRAVLPADCIEQTWPDLVRAQVLRSQHLDAQAHALDAPARAQWLAQGVPIPATMWFVQ